MGDEGSEAGHLPRVGQANPGFRGLHEASPQLYRNWGVQGTETCCPVLHGLPIPSPGLTRAGMLATVMA